MTCKPFKPIVAILFAALLNSGCEPETTIRVTSTADGASGSLRAAIAEANRTGTPVRIEVPTGTYELTRCSEDDDNGGGDLDLTTNANVRLEGKGPDVVVRQTCPDRVLEAHGSGVLSVVGLTLTGGRASASDGGGIKGGSVVLSRVGLVDNVGVRGGGVACSTLTAEDTTVMNNRADHGGGVFVATKAVVRRADVSKNIARLGAGLACDGELVISESSITQNEASTDWTARQGIEPNYVGGVGIWAETVVGSAITVAGNRLNHCSSEQPFNTIFIASGGAGIRGRSVSLVNSTVSGNQGRTGCEFAVIGIISHRASGIGVWATELDLEHVTLVGNDGGNTLDTNVLRARSSVAVGGREGAVCGRPGAEGSYSWFSDASCSLAGTGNRQEPAAFLLTPLADNGGAVATQAPALGSPLIDAVPVAACTTPADARGVARPQGSACDIGAVEVERAPGIGAADVTLAFSSAPSAIVAGATTTWQLTVRNEGPNASAPSVWFQVPAGLEVQAVAATGAGVCHTESPAVCTFVSLPVGGSATITFQGRLLEYAPTLTLQAKVEGPSLQPPFTDDTASATSSFAVGGLVRAQVTSRGRNVYVDLVSVGPAAAVGTSDEPIAARFHPAPGVDVVYDAFEDFTGVFLPSETPFRFEHFTLTYAGAPPEKVGDVELLPGLNGVDGPRLIPVFYAPPPDLAVRVRRQPGIFAEGQGIPVTAEITNIGAAAAHDVEVSLNLNPPTNPPRWQVAWAEPPTGSIEPHSFFGHRWRVPRVEPGQSLVIEGVATGTEVLDVLNVAARELGRVYEDVSSNNYMGLNVAPSPLGAADIRVEPLVIVQEPGTGRRLLRVTVSNAGAASYAGGNLRVQVSAAQRPTSVAPPPGWRCADTAEWCDSSNPLPARSSLTFEFAFAGPTTGEVYVSVPWDVNATPDHDPSNNEARLLQ